jgi:hypothetical protein
VHPGFLPEALPLALAFDQPEIASLRVPPAKSDLRGSATHQASQRVLRPVMRPAFRKAWPVAKRQVSQPVLHQSGSVEQIAYRQVTQPVNHRV